jgi:hypothetical protein
MSTPLLPIPPAPPAPGQDLPTSDPPPLFNTYAVVCLGALAVIFLIEVQRGIRLTTPLLLAMGLAGVLVRLRGGPILLLVTLTAGFVLEQYQVEGLGWRWYVRPRAFQVSDVVLCGAVLTYVASQYRLQALTRHVFPLDPRRREPVPGRPGKKRLIRRARSARLATAEEAALLLLLVPVPALLAQACWLLLARPWSIFGLPHPVGRLLLLGWALAVGGFVGAALLGHWRSRQMTGEEAELFLQDTLWQETRREQRRLNRWLAWSQLRRRKEGS